MQIVEALDVLTVFFYDKWHVKTKAVQDRFNASSDTRPQIFLRLWLYSMTLVYATITQRNGSQTDPTEKKCFSIGLFVILNGGLRWYKDR